MNLFAWWSSSARPIVSRLILGVLVAVQVHAEEPVFRTLAGGGGSGSADGSGSAAHFFSISGIAADAGGNVYVADSLNNTVRKVTPTGVVTTIAGLAGQTGSADGVGPAARFNYPVDVAVDKTGNLYVCDYFNFTIRKITPNGTVSTFAGLAGAGGSADGVGAAARFGMTGSGMGPAGLAIDSAGNVFVSDPVNNTIRKITPAGVVSTWAGLAGNWGTADGAGSEARFDGPRGLAFDASDNLYVADAGAETIRKITPERVVTTLAGSPTNRGSADGTSGNARFSSPLGVAVAVSGAIYVADWNNDTIRLIAPGGAVTTLAGAVGNWGYAEGSGAGVRFNAPWDVAVDGNGYLYVADSGNGAIRTTAPAVITSNPVSQIVARDESATFRVTTIWPAPSYQWNRNGVPIPGATSSTLILPSVTVSDAGTYTATITNGGTTVTSNPATLTLSASVYPTPYQFTTIAGRPGVTGSAGGSVGKLDDPYCLVQDSQGNLFVTDVAHSTIRKITPSGTISTFAGAVGQPGATDGPVGIARFSQPNFLAIDKSDNLYVTDHGAIRKITPAGVVSTVAGVVGSPGNVDGTGAAARLNPAGIAINGNGVIYFADSDNAIIRQVSSAGAVSLLAGLAGSRDNRNGTGSFALFSAPFGIAVDAAGSILVSDPGNHNIRKITPSGVVTTFAGEPLDHFGGGFGDLDATGTNARFHAPGPLWMSAGGDLYVGDGGGYARVRRITPSGVVTTFIASAGSIQQTAIGGIVQDKTGNFFVTDPIGCFVSKISPPGDVSVFSGHPGYPGTTDSDGPAILLNTPCGVGIDGAGNLVVADTGNGAVRRIVLPDESFPMARYGSPRGVAMDYLGNTYTADGDDVIRKINSAGVESVLAGTPGVYAYRDGIGGDAWFGTPLGVAVDSLGNVYVADRDNSCIRKITPNGTVTTYAGAGVERGSADGARLNARFMVPSAIAVDSADNLYVADTGNHKVRKISVSGEVTTLAGSGQAGSSDGNGIEASFYEPQGITVDNHGTVYLSDTRNHTIRRISAAGEVTTVGGWTGSIGSTDGIASSSRFNFPIGLAVDASGNLYIADSYNHTIRKGIPAARPEMILQPQGQTVVAGATATFSVSVGATGPMTYLWMRSADGGATWIGLSNNSTYSGVASAVLSVVVDHGLNGYEFRCVVSNGIGARVTSDAALLTVTPAYPTRPAGFDATGYLVRDPDVAAAIGDVANKLDLAWQHYWTYGLAEGRPTGDGFVADDYLAINPDLQAVFGTDRQGALLHWLAYGKLEGRMGSVPSQFELDTYFALNPDVLAVFGNNRRLAWFHYATYGILEGRSLDGWFSPAAYLAMYPDLVPALGGKPLAALAHWFTYGRAEGRGIPAWFDIVGYLARYPDVEAAYGTDLYGAWRHFVRWGAAAGRSPDPKFDPVAYLAAYPELRAGLGNDPVKALQHWIDWGKQEGRLGSIPAGWNPAYYLAHNPDLAAFGDDEAILWQHCIQWGVLEGREVAVDVKPSIYLALNPDLNVAFGGSQQKALLHWYLYGKAEGRLGR